MIKKIGLLVGGLVSLYALEACVLVDCTQTPNDPACADSSGGSAGAGGGDGGTGNTGNMGGGGAGNMGGGGSGNMGGGGAGGAAACDHCADYVTAVAAGTTPNPICADNTTTGVQSTTLLKTLNDCICDMANGCGDATLCGPTAYCTTGGPAADPTSNCGKCIQTGKCSAAFGACAGDSN